MSILASGDPDLALFENIQPSYYWNLEFADLGIVPWATMFSMGSGRQDPDVSGYYESYAWAVRPGPVPEPGTVLLLRVGVLGLVGGRRLRRRT